jgi:hypothetical protein
MDNSRDSFEGFLWLSVALTGFNEAELLGTGLASEYFQKIIVVVGNSIAQELWSIAQKLRSGQSENCAARDCEIRRELLASPQFGPIARNIVQLWYWGAWIQLPQAWRSSYGTSPHDITGFTSAAAYREGLIWRAMKTHPQGAHQPGFGSWSIKPRIY